MLPEINILMANHYLDRLIQLLIGPNILDNIADSQVIAGVRLGRQEIRIYASGKRSHFFASSANLQTLDTPPKGGT